MQTPGFVLFTSGSTDRPRPVYGGAGAALSMARAVTTLVVADWGALPAGTEVTCSTTTWPTRTRAR
jgi:acyl-coenzyme A synthetase/AMP-(fatty) acid ligase